MIYTDLTKKAMRIAYDAHFGQTDRGNTPYICHPLHVAQQFGDDETLVTAAILHDVLEDTDVTADDLIAEGIPERIVRTVLVLTRNRRDTYAEYITKIIQSGDLSALRVKLEDLRHNMDETRTVTGTLPEYLIKRYAAARKRIEEALERLRREDITGEEEADGQQSE